MARLPTPAGVAIALAVRRRGMAAVLGRIEAAGALMVGAGGAGELVLGLRWGVVVAVGGVRGGTVVLLHVADGALFLPRAGLVGVGVDAGGSWCARSAAAASLGARCRGVDSLRGALRAGRVADVAVALQDFFGGDVFVFVEEGGVVQE